MPDWCQLWEDRQCLIQHKSASDADKRYLIPQKTCRLADQHFLEHIWDGRMNFYWICTLYHWDHSSFDTLKLDLVDTSPRLFKPRPTCLCLYLLRVYPPCRRKVELGNLSCSIEFNTMHRSGKYITPAILPPANCQCSLALPLGAPSPTNAAVVFKHPALFGLLRHP